MPWILLLLKSIILTLGDRSPSHKAVIPSSYNKIRMDKEISRSGWHDHPRYVLHLLFGCSPDQGG